MVIPVEPVRNELARIDLGILVPRKSQLSADISIALDEAGAIGRIHPEDVTSWKTLAKAVRVLDGDLGLPDISLLACRADGLLQVNKPHSSQST
jgi:hypothetical protein